MSTPRRGLGRGLDVLLAGRESTDEVSPSRALRDLPIERLRPNPRQPRTTFEPAALAELEQSIRELGVLVPIIVRPLGGNDAAFELVAGERRWRAAAAAGLATIPAIVRELDDQSSLELAVVENLQREDLDPLEEAMGFQHLIDEYAFTQERLAERLGKSRPAISNALRLLGLSDAIKARVRSGALSVGHARALLAVDEADREALAARVERQGLTVRDVERLGERRRRLTPVRRVSPDVEAVESRLRYRLGAAAAIVPGARGGRVEIRYVDEADLTRIIDLIIPDEEA